MKLVLTFILALTSCVWAEEALKAMHPAHGTGNHRFLSINEQLNSKNFLLISELKKGDWVYKAKIIPYEKIELFRHPVDNDSAIEELMQFNKNFGVQSSTQIVSAWIVDVYEGNDSLSVLLSTDKGYIYQNLINQKKTQVDGKLYLPRAGVNKGDWKVVKSTISPTKFGLNFGDTDHRRAIQSIKFTGSYDVDIKSINKGLLKVDFHGDIVYVNEQPIQGQNLYNPTFIPKEQFMAGILRDRHTDIKDIKNYISRIEGGRKHCMAEINRVYPEASRGKYIAVINSADTDKNE